MYPYSFTVYLLFYLIGIRGNRFTAQLYTLHTPPSNSYTASLGLLYMSPLSKSNPHRVVSRRIK